MAPKYKLYYFNLKALAEPIRLIFAYAGVEFEDVRIDRPDWPKEKPNFPWEKVPVLEIDGKFLAQSNAILRYLGKLFNLAGDNEFETGKCDEMIEAMADLRTAGTKWYLEKDPSVKEILENVLLGETFPKFFEKWNKILDGNGGFLVGKKLSYADICIASYLQIYNDNFGGKLFEEYPALKSHQKLVFEQPGIKNWVSKRPENLW